MRGAGTVETHCGDKRLRRHILAQPWSKYLGNPGLGNGSRGKCSKGQGETKEQTIGDSEILVWRRVMPRWADDPVRRLEMLGWRRSKYRCVEYPVQVISQG